MKYAFAIICILMTCACASTTEIEQEDASISRSTGELAKPCASSGRSRIEGSLSPREVQFRRCISKKRQSSVEPN